MEKHTKNRTIYGFLRYLCYAHTNQTLFYFKYAYRITNFFTNIFP